MELNGVSEEMSWHWRHAAWTIDELSTPLDSDMIKQMKFEDQSIKTFIDKTASLPPIVNVFRKKFVGDAVSMWTTTI